VTPHTNRAAARGSPNLVAVVRSARHWLLAALSLALVSGCGGGGKVSATSLDPRLLAASSVPGFRLERTLDWSNPVNLVGEGVALPDITHPSAGVKEFQSAHLKGGAGEVLIRGGGLNASEIHIGVAKFDSTSDAAKVRSWMHGQDLQQPCFVVCAFKPQPMKLSGVPNSAAVVQTTAGGKPGSGPANYRAEFTVGPYLYWVWLPGDASAKTKSRFETGLGRYYRHAKQQKS
jgi:hypothetical protein